MKKILLGMALGIPLVGFEEPKKTKDKGPLQNFKKTIIKADSAPFYFMPWYALKCSYYFKNKPTDSSQTKIWLDGYHKQRQLESNCVYNKDVLDTSIKNFKEKNSNAKVVTNTIMNSLLFGGMCLGVQCTFAHYTGQPIDKQWTSLAAGFGAGYSLICHGSMTSIENKAQKIIDYNSQD